MSNTSENENLGDELRDNDNEIEKVLTDWFSNDLGIDKSKLTREARLT